MLYVELPIDGQIKGSIEQVLRIDGIDCTNSNVFATEVLLNTWIMQIADYSNTLAPIIWDFIKQKGLVKTIQACSQLADKLISMADAGWDWGVPATTAPDIPDIFDAYTIVIVHRIVFGDNGECIIRTRRGLKNCLQILRYPKRFAWPDNKQLALNSTRKFVDLNHAHGARDLKCRTSFYYEFADRICEKMAQTFKGFTLHDVREGCFTSGASADSEPALAEKLAAMAEHEGAYRGWIPWSKCSAEPYDLTCTVMAVPKNYKTARMIAKEEAGNTFHAKAVQKAMRRCFKRNRIAIYYDDQEINREGARLGALNGRLATIDHSSASDSIPRSLAAYVTPPDVYEAIINCRSSKMKVKKGRNSL